MSENTTPVRHFANWQKKDRVLLVGYSKKANDVLAIRLDTLPEEERVELERIAMREEVQAKYELTPILYLAKHSKSQETWLAMIASRLRRHDGSVIRAFVKDLYDVEPKQLAYYRGYGPDDAPGRLRISEQEKMAVLGDDYRQRGLTATNSSAINPPVEEFKPEATPAAAPPMDALAQALISLNQNLGKMNETLGRIDANTTPRKPGRPPNPTKGKDGEILNETEEG